MVARGGGVGQRAPSCLVLGDASGDCVDRQRDDVVAGPCETLETSETRFRVLSPHSAWHPCEDTR